MAYGNCPLLTMGFRRRRYIPWGSWTFSFTRIWRWIADGLLTNWIITRSKRFPRLATNFSPARITGIDRMDHFLSPHTLLRNPPPLPVSRRPEPLAGPHLHIYSKEDGGRPYRIGYIRPLRPHHSLYIQHHHTRGHMCISHICFITSNFHILGAPADISPI